MRALEFLNRETEMYATLNHPLCGCAMLCSYKGVEILEGHLMPDHVHMLVSIRRTPIFQLTY